MAPQHRSFFRYNITRPWPFRWFTLGVVIGGITLTVLFTFLNIASTGYNMVIQTSADPNKTTLNEGWLQHWPSLITAKVQPTCQPADVPVNSEFFTNQTALTYALTAVWQEQDGAIITISPALIYGNNPIENCSVVSIQLDLSALDRAANQISYSEWGAVVRTYTTCAMWSSSGQMFLNLTQTYEYVPGNVPFQLSKFLGTEFLSRNSSTRASLWWGESLMSTYWVYTSRLMQDIRANATSYDEATITTGTLSFTPKNGITDITDLSFFGINFRFFIDLGYGAFDVISGNDSSAQQTIGNLDNQNYYPNIWIPADSLAKSAYSTILTDLGQVGHSPNILADASLLQHYTSNFTLALEHLANAYPGPANQDYEMLKNETGPLGVTPSVISTRYTCQVPQLKSGSNLFIAVLVADLVFLQTAWQLYNIFADAMLNRMPNSDICEGCVKASQRELLGQPSGRDEADGDSIELIRAQ